MRQICDYDLVIFDCDGVILDSNGVKIDAMRAALLSIPAIVSGVDEAVEYFRNNFGRSRYHHVKQFLDGILTMVPGVDVNFLESQILTKYADYLDVEYIKSPLTDDVLTFLSRISAPKYVASGSEQSQLRHVLDEKALTPYFDGIYGSPTSKSLIVENIIVETGLSNALLIGDAVADYEAASANGIDFLGFIPYSNTVEALRCLGQQKGFYVADNWQEVV